jgi:lipopolysaccharide heptosyltransferase II
MFIHHVKNPTKKAYLFLRTMFLKTFLFFLSPAVSPPLDKNVHKILLMRIDRNGDLVLSTPLIQSVRQKYPHARIFILASPFTKDLIEGASFIDEVIPWHKHLDLKLYRFDLVIDLMSDYRLTTAWLAYKSKAKYRVGFDIHGRGVFFNIKVKPIYKERHFVEQMYDLLRVLKGEVTLAKPQLPVNKSIESNVDSFLRSVDIKTQDVLIGVHPGGFFKTQRWPASRFAKLCDEISKEYSVKVVIIGAFAEKNFIEMIEGQMECKPIKFIGFPLNWVTALLRRVDLVVCNNSGVLHMAAAVKTPTVSTMGPTKSYRWNPQGENHIVVRKDLPCIGCGKGYCRIQTLDCMKLIKVEDMFEAVDAQMQHVMKERKEDAYRN